MARIRPVEHDEVPDEIARMLDTQLARNGYMLEITRVLAHSPEFLKRMNSMALYFMRRSSLHPVLRELAVLTVLRLLGSAYEFERHVQMGLQAGIRAEQIADLTNWAGSPHFDEYERAVMGYAWQATEQVRVADTIFTALKDFLDEVALVDLIGVVAFYNMAARITVSLQLELEAPLLEQLRAAGRPVEPA